MGEISRILWIYRRGLGAHVRSMMEYEADFWLLVLAGLLQQLVGLAFLGAVFAQVPALRGWTFPEAVLLYGFASFVFGLAPLLFDGLWRTAWLVNQGELDYALVRPYPVMLQVSGSYVGMQGFGDVTVAACMIGWALVRVDVAWSPLTVLIGLILLASAAAVRISILAASTAVAFWLHAPHSGFAMAINQMGTLARYPLTIYGLAVRGVLTLLVPFAFTAFFPVSWLLDPGRNWWAALVTPVVAGACVVTGVRIYHRGVRRYESAGH
ncbi:ABC-2 type transport system permease protein [Catenuloplanes nepalensis]|uniref:ABC-2 type transport system permease protein n=1 Tax=Catenuloplanes nepalensis TaxID=587533 RepID=A0ABT9N9B3_9ACTN|nr:ABC-2 family transporter protein [Catenuloplanes nepalensis]MDP9799821.1 ABC-2 type transport system permease protein [Catenuloplanes nepalensis]